MIVLLLVGVGFYRGWFRPSTNNTDHKPSATITADKGKIDEDEQKAKDKMLGFRLEANGKSGDWDEKDKEPERRP
jgi:hypothetical protein